MSSHYYNGTYYNTGECYETLCIIHRCSANPNTVDDAYHTLVVKELARDDNGYESPLLSDRFKELKNAHEVILAQMWERRGWFGLPSDATNDECEAAAMLRRNFFLSAQVTTQHSSSPRLPPHAATQPMPPPRSAAEKPEMAAGGGDLAAWLAGPVGLAGKKLEVTLVVCEKEMIETVGELCRGAADGIDALVRRFDFNAVIAQAIFEAAERRLQQQQKLEALDYIKNRD